MDDTISLDDEDTQHYWKYERNLGDGYLEVTFNTHIHPLRKYVFEKLQNLIESFPVNEKKEFRILELGCGTGPNLWLVKDIKQFSKIYGFDFDCKAIDFCKKKFEFDKRFEFSCGDIEESEELYKDVFFDVVLISGVFSTMNEKKFAKKIESVLNLSFDHLILLENQGVGSERFGHHLYYRHDLKSISGLNLVSEEKLDESIILPNLEYFLNFKKTKR